MVGVPNMQSVLAGGGGLQSVLAQLFDPNALNTPKSVLDTGFVPPSALAAAQPQGFGAAPPVSALAPAAPAVSALAPPASPPLQSALAPQPMPSALSGLPSMASVPYTFGQGAQGLDSIKPPPLAKPSDDDDDDTPDAPAPAAKPVAAPGLPATMGAASPLPSATPATPSTGDKLQTILGGLGNLYGAGGPGDALIALGVGMSSGPGGTQRALGQIAQQGQQRQEQQINAINLELQRQKLAKETTALQGNMDYVKRVYADQGKTISDPEAYGIATNSGALSSLVAANTKDKADQARPLTDPVERAKFGILPSDTRPAQIDGNGKLSFPGAGGVAVNMPPTELSADRAYGDAEGKHFGDILKAGDDARDTLGQLSFMNDAFKAGGSNIQTGPAARAILAGKQAIQGITGIDLGGVPESEAVNKLGFGLASSLSRGITQRPAQSEFLRALQNVPGIFMSQPGSRVMMSILGQQAQEKIDLGQLVQDPANRKNWSQVQSQYFAAHPYVSPFTGKPLNVDDVAQLRSAAQQSGIDPETGQAASTAGAPKRLKYNPATGALE